MLYCGFQLIFYKVSITDYPIRTHDADLQQRSAAEHFPKRELVVTSRLCETSRCVLYRISPVQVVSDPVDNNKS